MGNWCTTKEQYPDIAWDYLKFLKKHTNPNNTPVGEDYISVKSYLI